MVKTPVVVAGPPGSGKSTVGPLLAEHFGVSFVDSDDVIVERAGRSIADIFTEDGESAFREIEANTIAELLAEHQGVLSVGGGAVLTPATRERLKGHTVVFLNVGFAVGVRRVGLSTARPLLAGVNPRATYRTLLEERLPVYQAVSTIEIGTDDRAPEEIVAAIAAKLSTELENSQ